MPDVVWIAQVFKAPEAFILLLADNADGDLAFLAVVDAGLVLRRAAY